MLRKKREGKRDNGGKQGKNGLVIGIGFLVLMLLGLVAVLIWGKSDVWRKGQMFVAVVIDGGEGLELVGVNRKNQRAIEIIIPNEMMMKVRDMEGEMKAGSLEKFGESEGDVEEIVGRSVEMTLGVRVDAVWKKDDWNFWFLKDLGNRLMFELTMRCLRQDQIERIDLSSGGSEQRLANGELVRRFEASEIKILVGTGFLEEVFLNEKNGVEIVNMSGKSGMARLMALMMESSGMLIVKLDEGEVIDGGCWFRAGSGIENDFRGWLKKVWGCRDNGDLDKEGIVRIELGKDWGDRYGREF